MTPNPGEMLGSLRNRLTRLQVRAERLEEERTAVRAEMQAQRSFLELAPQVQDALEQLSSRLFAKLAGDLETHLTRALQEVLEQPLRLRVEPSWSEAKGNTLKLGIERGGQEEDIMKGQGGSVANVLSVALRLYAIATLDPRSHRRFLVLDEPDCWLRPDLVPRLVRIVKEAAQRLGFQVLLISHHDVDLFSAAADRVYRLTPTATGASVTGRDR